MELHVSLTVTVDGRSFEISQNSEYTSSPLLHKEVQDMVLRAADAAVRAFPQVPSKYSDSLFKVQANGMHGVVLAPGKDLPYPPADYDPDYGPDYDPDDD
jgi:hypothetical protein